MSDTIFFRLLADDNKATSLSKVVEELREDGVAPKVYPVNLTSFRQIPGSPFAFWVSEEVRSNFTKRPSLGFENRAVKQGLATADDFRFVRTWWEVLPKKTVMGTQETRPDEFCQQTFAGKRWVPFAKGGEYSQYYADIHLLVNWERDGHEIRNFVDSGGRLYSRPQNTDFYLRPGLTWSDRTTRLFSARAWPKGGVFSVKGSAGFFPGEETFVLGLMNSLMFNGFLSLLVGAGDAAARSYQVGTIGSVPFPSRIGDVDRETLTKATLTAVNLKRSLDTTNETSHIFILPALLQEEGNRLADRLATWQQTVARSQTELARIQAEVDNITYRLYEISDDDRRAIEESLSGGEGAAGSVKDAGAAEFEDTDQATTVLNDVTLVADMLSCNVGCVFGRWDTRIALNPSLAPDLADPFAPLPVCSPGTLVGPDSLPAQRDGIASEEWMRARPDAITPPPDGSVENLTIPDTEYPLAVDWDGILVDDPEHPDDVVRRVRDVLDLLWGGHADEIEHEACGLLGIKDLRAFFRNPRKFWDFHVKRYSKSRRKAPIYWLLQSPKKNFGLWIYYHRLDPDILFKALTKYVEPKIRLEESRLEEYESQRRDAGSGGSEAKKAEKTVQDQETLLMLATL